MARYWPRSSGFCVFMEWDGIEVHKHTKTKKNLDNIQSISSLVNNLYIISSHNLTKWVTAPWKHCEMDLTFRNGIIQPNGLYRFTACFIFCDYKLHFKEFLLLFWSTTNVEHQRRRTEYCNLSGYARSLFNQPFLEVHSKGSRRGKSTLIPVSLSSALNIARPKTLRSKKKKWRLLVV